ncbi:hypothetical protein FRC91_19760 [Bradymonadales bacterium TMQ1]|uniref:CdiI immunity protein domain-containing protein n=1 Tax=Lujinxingia sediminis TaxID=2480984 RepID=A0ABY0CMZ6_9DELT|nr:hypothetical protein [Lujinxingia sediminis]RVU41034.1 hypothetical protein EA187_19225 [Lujinxingia sediminis]TXC67917.1 hypothetical protein FRC91_19760 [Bradymonadales bacterium TMQ1]
MNSNTERPQSLLDRWADFIRDVARGYTFTIYDYENDLSIRDHLERMFVELNSDSVSALIQQRVEVLDDVYRRVTTFVESPPWKHSRDKSDLSWWWHRVPNKLVGDLAEDLKDL